MTSNAAVTVTTTTMIPLLVHQSFYDWLTTKPRPEPELFFALQASGYLGDQVFVRRSRDYSRFDWCWFFSRRGIAKVQVVNAWKRYRGVVQ